jgi:opacity protein-like surface antigen
MYHRFTPIAAFAVALAACAASTAGAAAPAASPSPVPVAGSGAVAAADPDSIAAALRRATLPSSPRQVQFGWSLDEAGSRFNGRGVARYHAPDRFRLDLFGPRGETYLAAALVDETPRIPPAVAERFKLPTAALLWAAVGVVRPPSSARLASATDEGGRVTLRYDLGADGTLEYRAQGGRLQSVRRLKGGGVQESVELERAADGALRAARYRDWPAYRNLNLTLESSTDAASFPDDVWSPPGTGR